MNSLTRTAFVLSSVLLLASSSLAAELAPPRGDPILLIAGAVKNTNSDQGTQFDREMLEALGTETIVTKTPWFDGESEFTGVRLDLLMEVVGAEGQSVTAVALNDYVTTIPMEDFARYKVILALRHNGEYMSVRQKGPLFIIYPFDSDRGLQNQTYFGRAAWQVAKITVE